MNRSLLKWLDLRQFRLRRRALFPKQQDQLFKESILRLERYVDKHFDHRERVPYLLGKCNICGSHTAFFCENSALYRESLMCAECLTTSRYRSIARGILRAINELTGITAESIAELDPDVKGMRLRIYDTQVPFYWKTGSYPLPDLLRKYKWIELQTSIFRPTEQKGIPLGSSTTNQDLEQLTFPDDRFDLVVTSDVMEHVRLDNKAHREIRRVLRSGGIYLFTVPHFRDRHDTLVRVVVTDPSDPSKDQFPMEKEYHGDANSEEGCALSYRAYGTDLDENLSSLGFTVDYWKEDLPELAILNTELFYCKLSK